MRLSGIRQYIAESWSELKKVAWPTREMVLRLTLIVLAVSVVVGGYIAFIDVALTSALGQVLQ